MKSLLIIGIILISQVSFSQIDCSERLVKTKSSNGVIMPDTCLTYSLPKGVSRFSPAKEEIIKIEEKKYRIEHLGNKIPMVYSIVATKTAISY